MPELSHMLRQKLGAAQNGGGVHPDADQLAAFAEKLLAGAEREQVLTHLSVCEDCRDVVALSLPQPADQAAQTVIKPVAASGWRRLFSPAFGLAGLVAAMAIIAVVVLEFPGKSNREAQFVDKVQPSATSEQKPEQKKEADAKSVPIQPEATAPASNRADNLVAGNALPSPAAPAKAIDNKRREKVSQSTLTAGLSKKDFVNTSMFEAEAADIVPDNQSVANLPQAPQPQPSRSEARFTANAPGIIGFSDIPASQPSSNSNLMILTPPPPPERLGCPLCTKIVKGGARGVRSLATRRAPALSTPGIAFSTMGDQTKFSADLQKQQPAEVAAAPETPSSDGLQSFNALRSRSASGAGAAAAEYDSAGTIWKVVGGKLLKSAKPSVWEEAYPGASFQFTFVSARGNDVWAGGTNASLLHSHDGGARWEAAKLGSAASGSIVSILFSGAHVQVKTSDDQSWSSSDGGKTWAQN